MLPLLTTYAVVANVATFIAAAVLNTAIQL